MRILYIYRYLFNCHSEMITWTFMIPFRRLISFEYSFYMLYVVSSIPIMHECSFLYRRSLRRLLPLLNWEAMVLMNLLFEDEEACLEDLKRLCINERGSCLDNDRCEEGCFMSKKSSLSTCQQLFSDNPSNRNSIPIDRCDSIYRCIPRKREDHQTNAPNHTEGRERHGRAISDAD